MIDLATGLIDKYLYAALALFMFIEEMGIPMPLPGDAVLILIGVQSTDQTVNLWLVFIVTLVSTLIGSSALYLLAKRLGRPWLMRHQRILKYVRLSLKDVSSMEHYMHHYGGWFLIVSRLIPGLRVVGTVVSGILNVSYPMFIISTAVGTLIWTAVYFYLGVFLGQRFANEITEIFSNRLFLIISLVVGVSLWVLVFRFLRPVLQRHHKQINH